MRCRNYFIIVLMVFFMGGCINYLQSKYARSDKIYPGQYKARDKIAVLVQNESQKVHLEKINGRSVEKKFGVIFELLPGHYSLCIRLSYDRAYSKKCQVVEFKAQAGHTYEFYGVEDYNSGKWNPVVRDITDKLSTPDMERLAKKISAIMHNARKKQTKSE